MGNNVFCLFVGLFAKYFMNHKTIINQTPWINIYTWLICGVSPNEDGCHDEMIFQQVYWECFILHHEFVSIAQICWERLWQSG